MVWSVNKSWKSRIWELLGKSFLFLFPFSFFLFPFSFFPFFSFFSFFPFSFSFFLSLFFLLKIATKRLMFYNSVFSLCVSLVIVTFNYDQEIKPLFDFPYWQETGFIVSFFLSSILGFVLNYTIFMCTKLNSPLTTAVVGSIKNIYSTYFGMFFGDYVFSSVNFIGLNVSVLGSLVYSVVKYLEQSPKETKPPAIENKP